MTTTILCAFSVIFILGVFFVVNMLNCNKEKPCFESIEILFENSKFQVYTKDGKFLGCFEPNGSYTIHEKTISIGEASEIQYMKEHLNEFYFIRGKIFHSPTKDKTIRGNNTKIKKISNSIICLFFGCIPTKMLVEDDITIFTKGCSRCGHGIGHVKFILRSI